MPRVPRILRSAGFQTSAVALTSFQMGFVVPGLLGAYMHAQPKLRQPLLQFQGFFGIAAPALLMHPLASTAYQDDPARTALHYIS